MASRIDELTGRIAALEHELDGEFEAARARWRCRVERGRILFEREVLETHRRFRQTVAQFLRESYLPSILTAPLIYSLVVPIALLDLWVSAYQAICFRAWGIVRVKRSAYIVIDRQHLGYLNVIEKLNCLYCGYANGVFAYVREVAGRTEQYWCPIRHARRVHAPHAHYREFVDYGDAEAYRKRLIPLRDELRDDAGARDR